LEEHFIPVGGHVLRVLRAGVGEPLLLIHGFTDSAMCWLSLIEALAPRYDVIAYDSRGHGRATRVSSRYTIVDLADECAALLDALALRAPLLVAGHSMGAGIAALLAVRQPSRVKALVLEDPPFTPTVAAPDMSLWKSQIILQQQSPRDAVVQYYHTELHPAWGDADIQTRVDARGELDVSVFDYMDWEASPRWQDFIGQIACPGLLLTGDPALGALVRPEAAAALVAGWPALRHVHVPTVGHHIRCAAFAAYWQALNQFLQEVEHE
jgi:pimeloyl-ACP methyl ester carboxylesterase